MTASTRLSRPRPPPRTAAVGALAGIATSGARCPQWVDMSRTIDVSGTTAIGVTSPVWTGVGEGPEWT